MKGRVTIAGAGPGELEHLTLGALGAIETADVILYDALIGESITRRFPPGAEKIFVGKRCGNHAYTQTMIVNAMIEQALMGRHVVRLKGGDPAIFAHLASELAALEALEIPVKILPGVSAMLTAAAELKVPLTTRGNNRHVWITDGHSADLEKYGEEMARFPGTLVFYMGAGKTAEISSLLISWGEKPEKPAALIENAGGASAKLQRGKLREFADMKIARATTGPGIFLVGEALGDPNKNPDSEHGTAERASSAVTT